MKITAPLDAPLGRNEHGKYHRYRILTEAPIGIVPAPGSPQGRALECEVGECLDCGKPYGGDFSYCPVEEAPDEDG